VDVYHDALRRISTAAFGQSYRLELMLSINDAPGGIVSLTEIARTLSNVPLSSLQRPFEALVACGLLTPLPRGESRHRYYMRNSSAAWDWATELAKGAQSYADAESRA
jgi:hypothetical protein